ncbi:MAG: hypothetical protein IPH52_05175 [Leptospiraceae bacterium]|nr:hypothetical protein [Leptospiraceae bacterium]
MVKRNPFCGMENLRKYSDEGILCIYSEEDKKAKLKLNFQKDWNTPVLASLLDYLWKDGRAYLLSEERF